MATGDKFPVLMASQLGTINGPAQLNTNAVLPVTQGGTEENNTQSAIYNLGARPRKNLLQNWYFVGGGSQQGGGQFPINQRGQTSFSPASDAMDGWYYQQGGNSLSLTADGLLFPVDTATQVLRADLNPAQYIGKTVTISALFTDGALITATTTVPTSGVLDFRTSYNSGLAVNLYSTNTQAALQFRFMGTPTSNLTAIAAKLEIGEGQTLGYQNSTGAWQLFETPDYLETLQQCQQYQLALGTPATFRALVFSANYIDFLIPTPTTMAALPVVISEDYEVRRYDNNDAVDGFVFSIAFITSNGMRFRATKENHGLTDAILRVVNNTVIQC